jgi:hypothetical protein
MVALGDYIGLILSELTIGRAQADVESVRIAEIYSTNKILKNFAVPRLRLENVEITMPVAIDKVDPAWIDASKTPLESSKVNAEVTQTLTATLEKYKIPLSEGNNAVLRKAIDQKSKSLEKNLGQTSGNHINIVDTKDIADEYSAEIDLQLRKMKEEGQPALKDVDLEKLTKDIKNGIRAKLVVMRPPPARIPVLIQTSQIKEIGVQSVTTIKLNISEDAMEWTEYQTGEGESKEQLVSE